MIDFNKFKEFGSFDQHQLRNNVTIELEKSQDFIKNIWYTSFINIFVDRKEKLVTNDKLYSFFNSVAILASNQVKIKKKTLTLISIKKYLIFMLIEIFEITPSALLIIEQYEFFWHFLFSNNSA